MKIEYRVRPVTRYVVTRYHEGDGGTAGSEVKGTFDNPDIAHEVAYALCREEHQRAGTPEDDMNFQYPKREAA